MPRLDGRLAGGSMATGGGFGAVGVSGGGGGTGALAFGAFGVGGGWTYDAGRRSFASTSPNSRATLPKPVASMSLTKPLFSMARSVLRVSASTFLALAEPGASGECSPVRSGRCAFWCRQHALGDVRYGDFSALAFGGRPLQSRELNARRRQGCQTRWRESRPKACKQDS